MKMRGNTSAAAKDVGCPLSFSHMLLHDGWETGNLLTHSLCCIDNNMFKKTVTSNESMDLFMTGKIYFDECAVNCNLG